MRVKVSYSYALTESVLILISSEHDRSLADELANPSEQMTDIGKC